MVLLISSNSTGDNGLPNACSTKSNIVFSSSSFLFGVVTFDVVVSTIVSLLSVDDDVFQDRRCH